jgi:hypothetical protein
VKDRDAVRMQVAKQIYRQIQALARNDYGGNTNALLVMYAVEGFLRRLVASEYASNMTLKGGMLMASVSARRMTKDVDFSFGDAHRSTVVELPELLGAGTIRLASYPPEMSVAEKVYTMMSRREQNTRDRDFADTWVFSSVHRFRAAELHAAIVEVADHREHDVVPLALALADMPDRRETYTAMLRRMAYQRMPPESWFRLLDDVRAFIDPLVEETDGQLDA